MSIASMVRELGTALFVLEIQNSALKRFSCEQQQNGDQCCYKNHYPHRVSPIVVVLFDNIRADERP